MATEVELKVRNQPGTAWQQAGTSLAAAWLSLNQE